MFVSCLSFQFWEARGAGPTRLSLSCVHGEPEVVEEVVALDFGGFFVICPLILKEAELVLCHFKVGDWSWVLVLL